MGISGFLAGLARTAGAAAPVVSNVLAAKAQAQAQGEAQRRQEALQLIALERQERAEAAQEALRRAQTGYYEQRTQSAERVPVVYRPGDNNELYAMPSSLAPGDFSTAARNLGMESPSANPGANPSARPIPDPMVNPTAEPSPTLEQQRVQQGSQQSQTAQRAAQALGIRTGVHAPPPHQSAPRSATGMVNGRAVVGTVSPTGLFSPDTTASGDTVFARPRAGRSSSTSDPLDVQLSRSISSVGAQIVDTQRQRAGLDATVRAGREPFATPEAKQAAMAAVARQQRFDAGLDSLRMVRDRLVQQQQNRLSRLANIASNAPSAPAQPAPQPPSATPGTRLSPDQQGAMQAEFDAASSDLQAVLSSPKAPDAVKRQARQLYNQRQLEIARKYSAMRR